MLQIAAHESDFRDIVYFFLSEPLPGARGIFKLEKAGEIDFAAMYCEPTFTLHQSEVKGLITQLWLMGYRPNGIKDDTDRILEMKEEIEYLREQLDKYTEYHTSKPHGGISAKRFFDEREFKQFLIDNKLTILTLKAATYGMADDGIARAFIMKEDYE